MATQKNLSVQKAFAILRQFRNLDECVTSAELSRRAGLPEASGHRLITTLTELGVVVRNPTGLWQLGVLLDPPAKLAPPRDRHRHMRRGERRRAYPHA